MSIMTQIKNQIATTVTAFLDIKAKRINELSVKWTQNCIEIGKELGQAKGKFKRIPREGTGFVLRNDEGETWDAWLKRKTPWERRQADSFIQIAGKFGSHASKPVLSFKVFQYLAKSTVPEAAIDEVITRTKAGEPIGYRKAKQIVAEHLPTRSQAIKEAQETGRIVAARDGYMYSGADDQQMAAYSQRRETVYRMREAINLIASCDLTPAQWVKQAEDRWLNDLTPGSVEAAMKWLDKLQGPLCARLKVVQ